MFMSITKRNPGVASRIRYCTACLLLFFVVPPGIGTRQSRADGEFTHHWAFASVRRPAVPHSHTAETAVDSFVRARLHAAGIDPSPPAPRRILLRRATFDLTGLPPTKVEVEAFQRDPSPDAFEKVIDRLLASPAYGERWGRHWLDIARYADTKGYVFTEETRYPYAYTYRDYVVEAFNSDLPYDRFVLEQLAADLLRDSRGAGSLAALGFLTLGRRFNKYIPDIIDDRIDVVTRGLMGLTVACARCHDHKYDPVATSDYYSLYGIFASCHEPNDLPLLVDPENYPGHERFQEGLSERKQALEEFIDQQVSRLKKETGKTINRAEVEGLLDVPRVEKLRALRREIEAWRARSPFSPPRAMVLKDNATPAEPHIFERGDPHRRGARVPRRAPAFLGAGARQAFTQGSGRLQLARVIVNRDNPLTARVLVNRVWLNHFGEGLVRTPSNFGSLGERPTHPYLLDYLAHGFVNRGSSIKCLHREIMRAQVYRQSSKLRDACFTLDPDNRLLWRMNRRRLEFEPMRDSVLMAAGQLDRRMGGQPADFAARPLSRRRSIYALIDRQHLLGALRYFDFASPDASSPGRAETTVPQQALFLMNSPFVIHQANRLASRWDVRKGADRDERIRQLYRIVLVRDPGTHELEAARAFLNHYAQAASDGSSNATNSGQANVRDGTPGEMAAGSPPRFRALAALGQVLLVSNEAMYVD